MVTRYGLSLIHGGKIQRRTGFGIAQGFMVIERDVQSFTAGCQVGGAIPLGAKDPAGTLPGLRQFQVAVIQSVVSHCLFQDGTIERFVVRDDYPAFKTPGDFGVNIGEGGSVGRVMGLYAVYLDGEPAVLVARWSDQRAELIDHHSILHTDDTYCTDVVIHGCFKIDGSKVHACCFDVKTNKYKENVLLMTACRVYLKGEIDDIV